MHGLFITSFVNSSLRTQLLINRLITKMVIPHSGVLWSYKKGWGSTVSGYRMISRIYRQGEKASQRRTQHQLEVIFLHKIFNLSLGRICFFFSTDKWKHLLKFVAEYPAQVWHDRDDLCGTGGSAHLPQAFIFPSKFPLAEPWSAPLHHSHY